MQEKDFDEIQHPLTIKTPRNLGIEEIYLNIIKIMQNKHTANIILGVETQNISSKIRNKARMFTLTI